MPALAARLAGLILAFAPVPVYRPWWYAQLLLVGAILTSGQHTMTGVASL